MNTVEMLIERYLRSIGLPNLPEYLKRIIVINVFERGNPSGVVTQSKLYWKWPAKPIGGLRHGTVGSNSLRYLAGPNDRDVCAHQLIPRDPFTIYALVPPGYACGHAGVSVWQGRRNCNDFMYGYELESLQRGRFDDYSFWQYMKLAATWAYRSAAEKLSDNNFTDHADVAIYGSGIPGHNPNDKGRRSDPTFFNHMLLGGVLSAIRKPEVWPDFWHLELWDGGPQFGV
jgi:hypothetical protein